MSGEITPWLIRVALLAFSAEFRAAFAAEMEEDYAQARAHCTTRRAVWRLTSATAAELVRSGLFERRMRSTGAATVSERRARWSTVMDNLMRDLRHAVRALGRRPGFTLVAVVTLALGIGANTAIFSVVNAVLLRPLEWVDPDGLVMVWAHDDDEPEARGSMSLPDVRDIADLPAAATLLGFRSTTATVTSGDEPQLIEASRSSEGLMETFRVRPHLGRDLTAADAESGRPLVLVVGYGYWQQRLGGRADVIGTTVEISDVAYEVVGVAPAGFDFPDGSQLWYAWQLQEDCGRGCHTMHAIGRLADGASTEELSSQLATLSATLSDAYPASNFEKRFRAVRLADDQVGDVRRGLWFILGAVSLVLLIACANVANLLLVRGESRRGEVAVRAALGASRARLATQVLMESAVLAVAGALVGLGLARLAIGLVRAMPAGTVPRAETVSLDGTVLLFTLGLTALVMILFGLSPAVSRTGRPTAADLISERRGGSGPRASRSRSVLLTAEVALSVLLLVGAGLMLRSFDRLYRVELGFEPDNVTRFRLALPAARYDTIPKIAAFYDQLEDRLRALPGVLAVGSAFGPPLGSGNITADALIDGRAPAAPGDENYASMHSVTAGYLETMALPLLRGRALEATDRAGTLPVAVVSRTFVDENFPDEDPLGKRFEVTADFGYGAPLWTIVGVVDDVRRSLTRSPEPDVYVPLGQFGPGSLTVNMRTSAGVAPGAATLRDVVRSLDPGLPIIDLETVEDAMREAAAPTRFYLLTMAIFAGLAITLACVGLYGVVSYIVAQRGREIGIRLALGARRAQVVQLVLEQGFRPAAIGLVSGLALALALGRVAESLLFEVSPRDPLIMAAVAVLLGVVTFAASLIPAIRASRTDPAIALREP